MRLIYLPYLPCSVQTFERLGFKGFGEFTNIYNLHFTHYTDKLVYLRVGLGLHRALFRVRARGFETSLVWSS